MARATHKAGVEEKGKRTTRSADVYLPKEGESSLCKKCGALYQNKRWTMDEEELKKASAVKGLAQAVCPACQRMADSNPGGVITFSGAYLMEHEDQILNTIKKIEASSRRKNPLARIMEISQEKDILTVATTEDRLAQKLGREIYKAHKGELHYHWSHGESFVRVSWSR
ncbi:MAG: hypothetical protein ED859_11970 [Desulfuromonadales bacterium]|nr:MAG: hypothetical protein ED859_11970 [Desulfuromonadales bacterium]